MPPRRATASSCAAAVSAVLTASRMRRSRGGACMTAVLSSDRIVHACRATSSAPAVGFTSSPNGIFCSVATQSFAVTRLLSKAARVALNDAPGPGAEIKEGARIEAELAPYFAAHASLRLDPDARSPKLLTIEEGDGVWKIRQILLDPEGAVLLEGFANYRSYYKDALDKLGVEVHLIKVGTFKSAAEPYILNQASDAAKEADAYWMGGIWNEYLAEVAAPWHPAPDRLATSVLAFLDGIQIQWLRDPGVDLVAAWDAVAEVVLDVHVA